MASSYANKWISRPKAGIPTPPPGGPRCRLFCFPPAGAGPSVYLANGWVKGSLPAEIELMPVLYPGRSQRFAEPAISSVDALADAVVIGILPLLQDGTPFAFFGHSMGATVAYEITRRLAAKQLPLPTRLFASARRHPGAGPMEDKLAAIADDVSGQLAQI